GVLEFCFFPAFAPIAVSVVVAAVAFVAVAIAIAIADIYNNFLIQLHLELKN
ncbi:7088_t:CDS:1, partial [Ambispora leptoticha]